MSVRITAEAEALIQKKVDGGPYQSAAEVADEALRLLDARDKERQRLRQSIAEGFAAIERGEGIELTPAMMEERSRRSSERAAQGELPSLDVCP